MSRGQWQNASRESATVENRTLKSKTGHWSHVGTGTRRNDLIGDRLRKSTKIQTKLTAYWVETLIINRLGRGEQVETMASLLPAVIGRKACGHIPANRAPVKAPIFGFEQFPRTDGKCRHSGACFKPCGDGGAVVKGESWQINKYC